MLFVSGQIAIDPSTGNMKVNSLKEETEQVMANLKAVLEAEGMNFSHVLKSTIFLTDMGKFGEVNEIYGQYFDNATAPARETVQVAALPKGVQVEISVIAAQ
jgi:2-iminobutanoate/2-iminopropanoate deaminase